MSFLASLTLTLLFMSTSATIASLLARDTGQEARGEYFRPERRLFPQAPAS
jgi:hypothetical protein